MGFTVLFHVFLEMGASVIAATPPVPICISNVTLQPALSIRLVVQPKIAFRRVSLSTVLQVSNVTIVPPCEECC